MCNMPEGFAKLCLNARIEAELNYAWCYFCKHGRHGTQDCQAYFEPLGYATLEELKNEFDCNTKRSIEYFEGPSENRFRQLVPTVYGLIKQHSKVSDILSWPE